MDALRARDAMRAGAWAVAVVGAITRSADPHAAIAQLQRAMAPAAHLAAGLVPPFARSTLSEWTASGG